MKTHTLGLVIFAKFLSLFLSFSPCDKRAHLSFFNSRNTNYNGYGFGQKCSEKTEYLKKEIIYGKETQEHHIYPNP